MLSFRHSHRRKMPRHPEHLHLKVAALKLRIDEGQDLPAEIKGCVNELLHAHQHVLGMCTLHVKLETRPVVLPLYRLPAHKLTAMVQSGVIKECDFAWASPVVLGQTGQLAY
uniref:Uncharacterized protein n=1 Tax=Photinus pyralis TaxID=7054 RepID=A0A1Y1KW95_PHOPY